MRKNKIIALMIFLAAGLNLVGCNENEGIDPQIVEQLKTPCNGELFSSFHENATGWTLSISCSDKQKLEEQRKKMREGLDERVEPRSDGFDPLSYE